MLKPFPPFVASLHVTLRIEPLSRAIDETATFEKLSEGIENGALDAVRSTCWKGYSITIDKVPPAPEGGALKAWVDPDVVPTSGMEPHPDTIERLVLAINDELVRQHDRSALELPRYAPGLKEWSKSPAVTVGGILDVQALARAVLKSR